MHYKLNAVKRNRRLRHRGMESCITFNGVPVSTPKTKRDFFLFKVGKKNAEKCQLKLFVRISINILQIKCYVFVSKIIIFLILNETNKTLSGVYNHLLVPV